MENNKEQHLLFEIITYIINQTDSSDRGDNNILFFKNFDKVLFIHLINNFFNRLSNLPLWK